MGRTADRKRRILAALFALPLSLCTVLGYQLEKTERVTPGFTGVALFVVLAVILTFLVNWLLRLSPSSVTDETFPETDPKRQRRVFFTVWPCVAIPDFFVLLGVYPGFFVYDAQDELIQVLTRNFNTHHPLLHVLAMAGTVTGIHKFTGSWNLGIFTYLLVQLVIISGIQAYIISRLISRGLSRRGQILATLWYGIFPTVVMYTLCTTKDGLFAAFTTLAILYLTEQTGAHPEPLKAFLPKLTLLFTLMMLFRHNARHALLLYAALAAAFLGIDALNRLIRSKKSLKNPEIGQNSEVKSQNNSGKLDKQRLNKSRGLYFVIIISVILSVLFSSLLRSLMVQVLHASDKEYQESITVAIQSLGRTWVDHPDYFNEEDREVLFSYLGEEGLSRYEARSSDLLKATFNNDRYGQDPRPFWDLWKRMAIKAPDSYLISWLMTSYGLWYPLAIINAYEGHEVFTFTYGKSSYFGYETELPGVRHSVFPFIDRFYRWISLDPAIQQIPVLSFLFSPAFLFWLTLFGMLLLWYQKRGSEAFPFVPLLFLWMTYLIGPCSLVRYMVPFFTVLPILLFRMTHRGNPE